MKAKQNKAKQRAIWFPHYKANGGQNHLISFLAIIILIDSGSTHLQANYLSKLNWRKQAISVFGYAETTI